MAIEQIIEQRFRAAIAAALGPEHASVDPLVRVTANPTFGDYQANVAMSLAKTLRRKPRELAEALVAVFDGAELCEEAPTIAGPGFINVRLATGFLEGEVRAVESDERCGVAPAPAQTVVIDYSAPNVAKEMHVGHIRSTVIGDAIARVLDFLGHRVIAQNHIGDWGTQFGQLIEHLIDEGWSADSEHTVSDLNALYRAAKAKFDADEEFATRARARVVLLQGGDAPSRALWERLVAESERHFAAIYERLGVRLTAADIKPESFYNPMLGNVVSELQARGLAVESQGALCVFPDGFKGRDGEPAPVIVRKSDGGYNYGTTDLAAVCHRVRDLAANRVIYVVGAPQRQHFAMIFKIAEDMGWTHGVRFEHVAFGSIQGEDGRPFKTRAGDTIRLTELLDEAIERAAAIISEKNPDLDDATRDAVARAVGVGAIKYADLSSERVKDYVFSWERMLALQGNTAPYLQNAYVRIQSLFRKAAERGIPVDDGAGSIVLGAPEERALAMKLLQLPSVLTAVAETLEPHRLCTYLYELASQYHQFYERCPVLVAEDEATRRSRLRLSAVVGKTLRTGLGLLGIDVVDRM